jgi:hypothetical protein
MAPSPPKFQNIVSDSGGSRIGESLPYFSTPSFRAVCITFAVDGKHIPVGGEDKKILK